MSVALPPLHDGLTTVMQSPEFAALPLADQRLRIESIIRAYNDAALAMLVQIR